MQNAKLHFSQSENNYQIKEAYKTLRSNIEFSGQNVKVVSVTSCTPGEGKTSVAMALARAFAEAGKKTVLVDADMRKSVLVGRYKTGSVRLGLTHCLVGRERLSSVICETDTPNLYVIFSGPVPPNPSELLGGRIFGKAIENMKSVFDYVIIDTPPLGSVIDAAVVAKQCDGAVMVVESNAISYRFAQRVKDQLDKSGAKILGVVLNKVDISGKGYYGNYGHYYGKYGEDTSNVQNRPAKVVEEQPDEDDLDELNYLAGVMRKD